MALVLLFITSPAEEVFWRGFVQRWFMHRFGGKAGWLLVPCILSHAFWTVAVFILWPLTPGV